MEIFIISFIIYLITAIALGIGILFHVKSSHTNCSGEQENLKCDYKAHCNNACRRKK